MPDLLTGSERVHALLRLAESLESLSRGPAQRAAVDEAVALADASDDIALQAGAHRMLGHTLERAFEHEEATRELERALELVSDHGGTSPKGPVYRESGERSGGGDGAGAWRDAFIDAPYLLNIMASMGTVVDTAIEGLLLGSTAEKVLPRLETSLLVLKPKGFRSPVKA